MKKILLTMMGMLLILSLAACGSTTDDGGTADGGDEDTTYETREFKKDATIGETVIYDENGVKITATELTYHNSSAEVKLLIENNTTEDLTFISGSMGYSCNAVNGYMISDGYLNCDVTAGNKAEETVSFGYDDIMAYGIFEIADIQIGFDISGDSNKDVYTGPCSIVTSAAEGYDYEKLYYRESIASKEAQAQFGYSVPYFSDEAVYESNGLTIASQAVLTNNEDVTMLLLEVVNDTEQTVYTATTNIDVNGLRVYSSTWSYDTVNPGNTAIVAVALESVFEPEFFETYGIGEIGKIGRTMSFRDGDGKEFAEPANVTVEIPGADASLDKDGTEVYSANDVRIIAKGAYDDPSEYSDEMHILLLVENTSDQTVELRDVEDSLSVNGYMADYSLGTIAVESGICSMIDIVLWGSGLDDIHVSEASEVKTVEFGLTIRDANGGTIDEPTIKFDVK